MRLGIGSGRTVLALLEALGPRLGAGLRIEAACASRESAELARRLGVAVRPEDEVGALDLAIDGADILTRRLDCIKGGGGAMARERLVALRARRFVLIAEAGKLREDLTDAAVPIEVLSFGYKDAACRLRDLGFSPALRMAGEKVYRTDNGNPIYDCLPPAGKSPAALAELLAHVPGVVATGYFLGLADEALVAGPSGVERFLAPENR